MWKAEVLEYTWQNDILTAVRYRVSAQHNRNSWTDNHDDRWMTCIQHVATAAAAAAVAISAAHIAMHTGGVQMQQKLAPLSI